MARGKFVIDARGARLRRRQSSERAGVLGCCQGGAKHGGAADRHLRGPVVFCDLGLGLQAVEKLHGLLGMRRGAEDRALVVLEHG